jgi:hypothetical protein
MLRQVWNGSRFPLGDRLKLAVPEKTTSEVVWFSGTAVGIDTAKLAYFGLSVLWRAAVHVWPAAPGEETGLLDLGNMQEPLRKYLHEESAFPAKAAVIVHVCTDSPSIQTFHLPAPVSGIPGTVFVMTTLGIHFMIAIGVMPPVYHELCCVASPKKVILQRNCLEKTLMNFARLKKTGKTAKILDNL